MGLELALDLEGITECGEEMHHAIIALVVGARSDIPLALGSGSLLKVHKYGHVDGREKLPIGNVFVLPAITAANDVVLAVGHFILFEPVAGLGIVDVFNHETIFGEDNAQSHSTVCQKRTKPDMQKGKQTGPKTGITRWDDLTGIVTRRVC